MTFFAWLGATRRRRGTSQVTTTSLPVPKGLSSTGRLALSENGRAISWPKGNQCKSQREGAIGYTRAFPGP
ncbi:MAG: hypothetical protein JWN14_897 [Chthonomonadales bacterium]|nr:hypothetical protein [Chthonomonadales bacterium]